MNAISALLNSREFFSSSITRAHSKNMAHMNQETRYQQTSVFQYLDLELLNLKYCKE